MPLATKIKNALRDQWSRPVADIVQIELPYPVSTNALWMRSSTTGQLVKSPRYATWFRSAGNELALQRPGRIEGKYSLEVLVERKSGRRDIDNTIKSISDLLVDHQVIEDDSLAQRVTIEWSDTAKGAWVTIRKWGSKT